MSNLGMNQLYGNPFTNPYAIGNNYSQALNSDFMATATQSYNPYATAGLQAYQQPTTDQFVQTTPQQTSGGSGLGTGAKLGLVAGAGTTAGLYFFGGDKINPFKDGKFNDKFLKTLEDSDLVAKEVDNIKADKISKILADKKITDTHQFNAIKEFATTGKAPASVTLPANLTQEQAKTLVTDVEKEVGKISTDAIKEKVIRTKTLDGSTKELTKLNSIKSKLTALPDNISVDDLTKHIKDNAKLYGINVEGDALETAARKMAEKGKTRLVDINEYLVNKQTSRVNSIRTNLTNQISSYWDDTAKCLKAGAPENLQKAVKGFKLKTAGKWGAIAAGAGLLVGWMFGGNKS